MKKVELACKKDERGPIDLVLLTDATALHIVADKGVQARPPIVLLNHYQHFGLARVSSCLVIVQHPNHILS